MSLRLSLSIAVFLPALLLASPKKSVAADPGPLPVRTVALSSLGPLKLGDPAPWFASPTAGGKVLNRTIVMNEVRTAEGKGYVLAFFATWCLPCRHGLKMLGENRARLEAAGIRAYLVDASLTGNSPDTFLAGLGAQDFPVLPDPYGVISEDFGMLKGENMDLALPKTFLITADGRIRAIFGIEGKDYIERILSGK